MAPCQHCPSLASKASESVGKRLWLSNALFMPLASDASAHDDCPAIMHIGGIMRLAGLLSAPGRRLTRCVPEEPSVGPICMQGHHHRKAAVQDAIAGTLCPMCSVFIAAFEMRNSEHGPVWCSFPAAMRLHVSSRPLTAPVPSTSGAPMFSLQVLRPGSQELRAAGEKFDGAPRSIPGGQVR